MAISHGKHTRRWSGWQYKEKNEKAAKWRKNMRQAGSENRQIQLREFVEKHGLSCFKCGDSHDLTRWAKTGVSGRGPWAICAACVTKGTKRA